MITVSKDNTGDFLTIQEAIQAVTNTPETIFIKNGIYKERIEVTTPNITFEGEDSEKTIVTFGYYANMLMEDGIKRGTFRSYTALFFADNITVKNMTIENSSGFGKDVGQAVAVYAEGDGIHFDNCRLLGHQDTLFTGPLPLSEKQKGGFVGPTEFAERRHVRQLYENCFICGEVDFIFGSATAYFDHCTLYALNRNEEINSFYTAPSTYDGQTYGYVFHDCKLTGNCPKGTVMLSRPWREHAKTVFLNCDISDQVAAAGYHDWNKAEAHTCTFYGEYNCTGSGSDTSKRVDFAHQLTDEEALAYTKERVLA